MVYNHENRLCHLCRCAGQFILVPINHVIQVNRAECLPYDSAGSADLRLWSISPEYLDPKGLVALWREALLAQKVLEGQTRGYRNHPQLERFRAAADPLEAIAAYLHSVADEADARGYRFNRERIHNPGRAAALAVTSGQVDFEFRHLLGKLAARAPGQFSRLTGIRKIRTHPLFHVVPGGIEHWEKTERPPAPERSMFFGVFGSVRKPGTNC